LEHFLRFGCASHPRTVRNLARDVHRESRVAAQELEGPAPRGLCDQLRAEIGRPDGVRLGHGRRATILVPFNGKRETEGEDQPDHPEQRRLKDSERLAERGGVVSQISARSEAGERRRPDDGEHDQPELPAAQPEEHGKIFDGRTG
jgi:hypothetical protein